MANSSVEMALGRCQLPLSEFARVRVSGGTESDLIENWLEVTDGKMGLTTMNSKKSDRVLRYTLNLLSLVVIVICVFFIWSVWRKFSYQPQSTTEMIHFSSRIELGQSSLQVRKVFDAGRYTKLKIYGSTISRWKITTPIEWGAGNWILHIDYNKNGRVVAVRFRTEDSIKERPEVAPPDRVAPNWTNPFP